MKRKLGIVLTLAILLSLQLLVTIHASANTEIVRVIVGIESVIEFEHAKRVLSYRGVLVSEIPEIRAIVLRLPHRTVKELAGTPFIRYIEEDLEYRALEVQWNIIMINATVVWNEYNSVYGDAAYGYHRAIQVAVLDTGIDSGHRDLRNSIVYCIVSLNNGGTYYEGTNLRNCNDPNGHGTHVAGIIAARLNNYGVAGVAPKVVLYAVRVLDASGRGYVSDIAKGIVESVKGPDDLPGTDDDADVISMSLGGGHSQVLYDAVKYAYENGAVLVAAAGNSGGSTPLYPAAYPEVIAVGAVDSNYTVPWWSNRNPDVVAPGVDILSTLPKSRFGTMSGTSMACPHVSGTVAIVQALRLAAGLPKLTPSQMIELVRATAVDLGAPGYDAETGYGLLNAHALVRAALAFTG